MRAEPVKMAALSTIPDLLSAEPPPRARTGQPGDRFRRATPTLSANQPSPLSVVKLWETEEAHQASLELPGVQTSIKTARPLLRRVRTDPIQRCRVATLRPTRAERGAH